MHKPSNTTQQGCYPACTTAARLLLLCRAATGSVIEKHESSQKPEVITYRDAARRVPSHGHLQHELQTWFLRYPCRSQYFSFVCYHARHVALRFDANYRNLHTLIRRKTTRAAPRSTTTQCIVCAQFFRRNTLLQRMCFEKNPPLIFGHNFMCMWTDFQNSFTARLRMKLR